jgi:hypothetical protein
MRTACETRRGHIGTIAAGATLAACIVLAVLAWRASNHVGPGGNSLPGAASSLAQLLELPATQLALVPVARMNLLCADGLLLLGNPDAQECQAIITAWAKRVQAETERHWYRFRANPAEFENSPGFFRMLMLSVVLAEDYCVHYNEKRKVSPANAGMADGFFSDPSDVFLHGLLGPARHGTCSSLPVLHVAVGRELGYPLKLVTTKAHLFVRWEGDGERFNIEAAGERGLNRFSDDYYRHWPFDISAAEQAAEGYLKSLTPSEELAVFLSIRGMCLREAGRLPEAAEAFAAAARLSPGTRSYQQMAVAFGHKLRTERRSAADKSASTQRDDSRLKL